MLILTITELLDGDNTPRIMSWAPPPEIMAAIGSLLLGIEPISDFIVAEENVAEMAAFAAERVIGETHPERGYA